MQSLLYQMRSIFYLRQTKLSRKHVKLQRYFITDCRQGNSLSEFGQIKIKACWPRTSLSVIKSPNIKTPDMLYNWLDYWFVFSPNAGKCGPEWRTFFTQYYMHVIKVFTARLILACNCKYFNMLEMLSEN